MELDRDLCNGNAVYVDGGASSPHILRAPAPMVGGFRGNECRKVGSTGLGGAKEEEDDGECSSDGFIPKIESLPLSIKQTTRQYPPPHHYYKLLDDEDDDGDEWKITE
jgi:hypothetical protein